MTDLVALGVQTPQINTVGNAIAARGAAIDQNSAIMQQHMASIEAGGQLAFGLLDGDPNGKVSDPARVQQAVTMLGGPDSPAAKALLADPTGWAQQMAKTSISFMKMNDNQQQNMLLQAQIAAANPNSPANVAARALQTSETAKNNAEAGMYTSGGPIAPGSTPLQMSDGSYSYPRQYGGVERIGADGNPIPATPPLGAPPPGPSAEPSVGGVSGPFAGGTPAPAPAPTVASAAPAAAAPAAAPTIMTPQQTEFAKADAAKQVDAYHTIVTAAQAARQSNAALGQMTNLMQDPNFYSGFQSGKATALKQAAVAFGLADPNSVASIEQFDSLANQQTMSVIGHLGTGISDADRSFVVNMQPGLSRTKAGNAAMIKTDMAVNERAIKLGDMADAYVQKHGQLDAGFNAEISQYAKDHPISGAPSNAINVKMLDDGNTYYQLPNDTHFYVVQ